MSITKISIIALLTLGEIWFGATRTRKLLQMKASILNARVASTASGSGTRRTASIAGDSSNPVRSQEFQASNWVIDRAGGAGTVRLSGGIWQSGRQSASESADDFLRIYGQSILKIDPRNLIRQSTNDESGSHTVIYSQNIDGVQVYNSRISLVFDDKMNLIYVGAQVYDGAPHSSSPSISLSRATEVALGVVQGRARSAGGAPDAYSSLELNAIGQYFVYLSGGIAFNVYRFVVPLVRPLAGELEIFIDASTGAISSVKNLARQ